MRYLFLILLIPGMAFAVVCDIRVSTQTAEICVNGSCNSFDYVDGVVAIGCPNPDPAPIPTPSFLAFDDFEGDNIIFDRLLGDYKSTNSSVSPTHSLRMRHIGKPSGKDSRNGKRFTVPATREVYWSFWLMVPTNFTHRRQTSSANNKFGCIWTQQYEGNGLTICWEYWPDGSGGSELAFRHVVNGSRAGGHQQRTPVWTEADQGRWAHFILHVDPNNGVIQTSQRWANETNYVLLHDISGAPINVPGEFDHGYWQGWANSGFDEETVFLGDDFKWSNDG